MKVGALRIDLRIPDAQSRKGKRAVIKTLISTLRAKFEVAVAETGHLDAWQLSTLGVSAVSGSANHLDDILDNVEDAIRSWPEVEVLAVSVVYLEESE